MRRLKFVTLHPAGTNVDLIKDEGQIPFTLSSNYAIDAEIVTCHIDLQAENIDMVKGLTIHHIPFIINNALSGLLYLLKNSKKIDWLNIYFAGRQAIVWTKVFKFLNPKGKVFLKLDMDFRSVKLYEKDEYERKIFRKCTDIVDLVSVESKVIRDRIQKYSLKEIYVIGNGISNPELISFSNYQRNNTFITVARLGTQQKATDILLQGFAKSADKHNWNLILIGKIQTSFKQYIEDFFMEFPNLQSRIFFLGPINDREHLYSEYSKSKVFVLPSRWESYGISAAEALCCGCHLILTDTIPLANEMTKNGSYGTIIKPDSIDSLSDAFIKATKKHYSSKDIDEIIKYANDLFSWEEICKRLYTYMKTIDDRL